MCGASVKYQESNEGDKADSVGVAAIKFINCNKNDWTIDEEVVLNTGDDTVGANWPWDTPVKCDQDDFVMGLRVITDYNG